MQSHFAWGHERPEVFPSPSSPVLHGTVYSTLFWRLLFSVQRWCSVLGCHCALSWRTLYCAVRYFAALVLHCGLLCRPGAGSCTTVSAALRCTLTVLSFEREPWACVSYYTIQYRHGSEGLDTRASCCRFRAAPVAPTVGKQSLPLKSSGKTLCRQTPTDHGRAPPAEAQACPAAMRRTARTLPPDTERVCVQFFRSIW